MKMNWLRIPFRVSAIYDFLAAILFIFWGPAIYDYAGIERPNHLGYLHFPALLLILFAIMYWRIASDPVRFRDFIPYGIGLKVSFSAVVFYHRLTDGIPTLWLPFAWIDVVFMILFILAWGKMKPANQAPL